MNEQTKTRHRIAKSSRHGTSGRQKPSVTGAISAISVLSTAARSTGQAMNHVLHAPCHSCCHISDWISCARFGLMMHTIREDRYLCILGGLRQILALLTLLRGFGSDPACLRLILSTRRAQDLCLCEKTPKQDARVLVVEAAAW